MDGTGRRIGCMGAEQEKMFATTRRRESVRGRQAAVWRKRLTTAKTTMSEPEEKAPSKREEGIEQIWALLRQGTNRDKQLIRLNEPIYQSFSHIPMMDGIIALLMSKRALLICQSVNLVHIQEALVSSQQITVASE